MATNTAPGRTLRESYSTPVTESSEPPPAPTAVTSSTNSFQFILSSIVVGLAAKVARQPMIRSKIKVAQVAQANRTWFQSCHLGARCLYYPGRKASGLPIESEAVARPILRSAARSEERRV